MSLACKVWKLDVRSRPALGEQIDIGAIDELRRLHTQPSHELLRFSNTGVGGFVLTENYFELEERSKTFDAI